MVSWRPYWISDPIMLYQNGISYMSRSLYEDFEKIRQGVRAYIFGSNILRTDGSKPVYPPPSPKLCCGGYKIGSILSIFELHLSSINTKHHANFQQDQAMLWHIKVLTNAQKSDSKSKKGDNSVRNGPILSIF